MIYARSDGSKNGIGARAYSSTSSRELGKVWGRAVLTPGNVKEMASLRPNLGGTIGNSGDICTICTKRGINTPHYNMDR